MCPRRVDCDTEKNNVGYIQGLHLLCSLPTFVNSTWSCVDLTKNIEHNYFAIVYVATVVEHDTKEGV